MKWIKIVSKKTWWLPVTLLSVYLIGLHGSDSSLAFYIISFFILFAVSVFCGSINLALLPKHRKLHASLIFLSVFLCAFGVILKNDSYMHYDFALYSLISIGIISFLLLFIVNKYGKEEIIALEQDDTPEWVIKSVMKNMLKDKVKKRLTGRVASSGLSIISGNIAAAALTESRAAGHRDSCSDGLLSTAMNIAEQHITAFEGGSHVSSDYHRPEFNPATGLAMTSDYYDAGGDTYGSSLNHDRSFSFDNSISAGFDSHSTDHGSSFNSGFDDNRY